MVQLPVAAGYFFWIDIDACIGIWTIIVLTMPYDVIRTVIKVGSIINVINFSVDNVSDNANINFGPSLQNSHTANSINIGTNINIGDNGTIISKIINKGIQAKMPQDSSSDENQ
ncbi:hypothetical protein [Neobacillus cucumis]|uniref:hypothetical protein n=1 Tax=Neobacillus cucumis TaxID=1740721 RepID=UPI002E1D6FEE|nr:hypothetical protein [Neobacillus cucumis]